MITLIRRAGPGIERAEAALLYLVLRTRNMVNETSVLALCSSMSSRIAKLEAAVRINSAVCAHAERLIAAYIAPGSDRAAIISELDRLLNGPPHREAKRLAEAALDKTRGGEDEGSVSNPRMRPLPRRIWAEIIVGATTGLLCVVTLFRPDWIEAVGFDPDQHDGSIEWLIGIAMLVVTLVMLGAVPWLRAARNRTVE